MPKSSIRRTIKPPQQFKSIEVAQFISDCEFIFKLNDSAEDGFLLDLSKVKRVSMLGALIVYKIVEYSVKHNCFLEPKIDLGDKSEMAIALNRYGFTDLISSYLEDRGDTIRQLKNLKVSVGDAFIIAPQALIRDDRKNRLEINRRYLPQIETYYSSNQKTVSMIFLVFSEILLNFWEHASLASFGQFHHYLPGLNYDFV